MDYKLEQQLIEALLTNWNTDENLTPIEKNSQQFDKYVRMSLAQMVSNETALDWIVYFEKKQAKLNVGSTN